MFMFTEMGVIRTFVWDDDKERGIVLAYTRELARGFVEYLKNEENVLADPWPHP